MANKLNSYTTYTDSELVQIPAPDGTTLGYQFDRETRSFYARESSLIFSGRHGNTHIGTDPIPAATCATPGLMSSDDKCKLDSIVGTRVGILGFQGAGFPDDAGWLDGDIILAAGNEAISLERVGNVVRFIVENPVPFTCTCETCLNIFLIQDETEANSVRIPSCNGKLPNLNNYGELKVYLFPESIILNPANPTATLNKKGLYPTFIFKRYDDGIDVNVGELDIVLKRNANTTAQVGWAFTPGATGKPEWVTYLGLDDDGNQITFKLDGNLESGLLGALLYKGHVITKQMAVITGYHSTVVQTNQYKAKFWDVVNHEVVGDEFTITNTPQYDLTANAIVLDSTQDTLLAVGQLVDVWSFKVGETSGVTIYNRYCKERPALNPQNLWTTLGAIEFGNILDTTDPGTSSKSVDDFRTIERDQWGIIGLDDNLEIFLPSTQLDPVGHRASIDTASPAGLAITEDPGTDGDVERPIEIWHKAAMRDSYLEIHLARPQVPASSVRYPPIDVLVRAPIDSFTTRYAVVISTGSFTTGVHDGADWIRLSGLQWAELPPRGRIRVIYSPGSVSLYGMVIEYTKKLAFPMTGDRWDIILVTDNDLPSSDDIVEILHEDYTTPAIRLQFEHDAVLDSGTGGVHDIIMRPVVGTLDTSIMYDTSGAVPPDDFVGGFEAGFAVGRQHWQDGSALSGGTDVSVDPENFIVYTGATGVGTEVYNVLKVLVVDLKVWLWWNDLLLAPSTIDSAALPTPVTITTPYFPITDIVQYGKFGVRLWPGAKLRRFIIRSRPIKFSELTLQQIEVE